MLIVANISVLQNNSYQSQSSIDENSFKEQLAQKEEIIECLQAELVKVRLREAENDALIRDLRARIHDLEEVFKMLFFSLFFLFFFISYFILPF